MKINREFLKRNQHCVFVFGDNTYRSGNKGAAELRDCENSYGFITKKFPSSHPDAFYTSTEYAPVYEKEIQKLREEIKSNPEKTYLISKVGGGLANKFHLFEQVIEPNIKKDLKDLPNIKFLW